MKPEIKKLWIEALLSGEYIQGKMRLRSVNDKFCCLGVLCDLKDPDGWDEDNYYDGDEEFLPESVMKWAGLESNNGAFERDITVGYLSYSSLSNMNDLSLNFRQIAKVIDERF